MAQKFLRQTLFYTIAFTYQFSQIGQKQNYSPINLLTTFVYFQQLAAEFAQIEEKN